ncbi:hypothetical protein CHS0354_021355 [Potamilus streckersoni]|uniref:SRCR domain-containing protein n=1 Tax=Potamilus streckersoni TaxID=2493646 RepID=A0AAE0VPX1_9BIVA|nr:hypothetical protein CHS0354_021355 [Potamilus streckersoni]
MQGIFFGFLFIVISQTVVTGINIRLVNAQNPLAGNLQIMKDGIWSYICIDSWNTTNTKVICRMLTNTTYQEAYSISWPYLYCVYNVTCSGNEQSIDECIKGFSYRQCLQQETVAVRCGENKIISSNPSLPGIGVRLVDGYTQYEGKVEVLVDGIWRRVANTNNSWGNREANVICRMLGYSINNATGFQTPTLTRVQCAGDEASIDLCSFQKGNYCERTYNVYITCSCSYSTCKGSTTLCDLFLGTCESVCSPGRYVSEPYCNACNKGTFQPAINQTRCYLCPFGTYQNLTGQASCTACPAGNYLNMIGSETPCKPCPRGTYQEQIGQVSCKLCAVGSYQNMTGQAACIPCESGTYQNSSGKTACIPCLGGKTTDRPGAVNQSECYKKQRNDLRQQTNFDILIIGASLLTGVIIFDIISCAILLRRMTSNSGKSNDTKTENNRPALKKTEFGSETTFTNDTVNSSSRTHLQPTKWGHVNAARNDLKVQEYETLHSYSNAVGMYDVSSVDQSINN